MSLHDEIARVAMALPGRMGVAIRFLNSGQTVSYHAEESFPSASVIKVLILAEVYRRVDQESTLDLGRRMVLGPESRVLGSGVLSHLRDGLSLTVEDAARLMIMVSDNVATNMLLDLTGIEPVNALIAGLGLTGTRLNRKIDFEQPGPFAITTPADMLRFYTLLDRRELISPTASEAILAILKDCAADTMIPRYLPLNPYAEELGRPAPPVEVAHKTGGLSGVRNDAGLVILHRPGRDDVRYIVSAFTADVPDGDLWTPENVAVRAVAEVARLAYQAAQQ